MVLSEFEGGIFLRRFATGYISLRKSWDVPFSGIIRRGVARYNQTGDPWAEFQQLSEFQDIREDADFRLTCRSARTSDTSHVSNVPAAGMLMLLLRAMPTPRGRPLAPRQS
ncbi:hypothetical protein [Dictyobacter formicarum]|uniref:Uncharacterized protein n=1 Tax=Dictyobacter formicarum TaxID=2778368 RepID=A0ABQ3VLU3_9CHLR|nr:hypothetical protein [Dictyobacter formicarum]GHO87179.1 hypothetical protein KSZ_51850 [Dictyobacter formicarum]